MDTVTIPRSEYDALRAAAAELEDVTAHDDARAALSRGEEELVPEPFASRIMDGESPVRVFRELRGHSQSALARLSGVNRVQIVEIEGGRATGSAATLGRLAAALKVTLDDLAP
ncbi:helix-turn-helix transcriptional regulator [Jannaschia formosa]|uniref:helix-turn-helix transcriptional regulator n=1 Tax=Jannaschia formosa TaxID=2259592 RepID=UPI000E1BF19E|nr:helix-turn-helix transcriptional regulator [Jannaschia formosa]TFL18689.1 XRE family transcriptional regulator [Jannaschia formosa]